jgi:CheY-like chemotaxis protein/HPt (histidine-containing phosphotransfer) domain-containing protein
LLVSAMMRAEPMPLRVLVVDDDEMSRELLSVLLEANGYAVESADSGVSALAHLNASHADYDLILTDMQMPGISGDELAAELRKQPGSAVLLAMSGTHPAEDALAQFDGFLLKPFNVQQLAATLDRVHRLHSRTQSEAQHEAGSAKVVPISSAAVESAEDGVAASPALNTTIYDQLARTLPARQLGEMYSLCINDARERIQRMHVSAEDHDSARFRREAHAIKGSAGMLGATQIHIMASDLELRGLEGPGGTSEAVNFLAELSAACDRLERMLGTRAQG